jgi:hypothetical protein
MRSFADDPIAADPRNRQNEDKRRQWSVAPKFACAAKPGRASRTDGGSTSLSGNEVFITLPQSRPKYDRRHAPAV